jgi:23S rRNA (guanosine2251-2'-O)-methyltransferase
MLAKKTMLELHRLDKDAHQFADKIPVTVVLDDIRSMHNVGSVFRTSDSFAVEKIILCGFTPTPPHHEIQKTALGATETVTWEYITSITDALNLLCENEYTVISVEQTHGSISLEQFKIDSNKKYALVFGNEVEGVSDEALALSNFAIEIPQGGTKHSLNISVAAGVTIWPFYAQLKNPKS